VERGSPLTGQAMDRALSLIREAPYVAGVGLFLVATVLFAMALSFAMQHVSVGARPIVFFLGYLVIIAGPQGVLHGLDAWLGARAAAPSVVEDASPARARAVGECAPIPWAVVFGPDADPDLIADAKLGLEALIPDAEEAQLSFRSNGESSFAARFASPERASEALDRYGAFFQFAEASGDDSSGWTARRYGGAGEWNHVVRAGRELYAWTGPTREAVLAQRVRALGDIAESAANARTPNSRAANATRGLRANTGLMATFVALNLIAAVAWFFRGSAWATRTTPPSEARTLDGAALRERLLALNELGLPIRVTPDSDGRVAVEWRRTDARWIDWMRAHSVRSTTRLLLDLDESSRAVRVFEFWSSVDASAGPSDLRLRWRAARGIQFFDVQRTRVFGMQFDEHGRPTGEWSRDLNFDVSSLKAPLIDAVTSSGWTWQPLVCDTPRALRWLTE